MKLNFFQKIILTLYGCFFIYFTVIHVPFKTNYRSEIKYDTLFSNSSNLDTSRLLVIVLVISILAAVLLLLLRIATYTPKSISKNSVKIIAYSASAVILLFFAGWGILRWKTNKKNLVANASNSQMKDSLDSVTVVLDTTASTSNGLPPFLQKKAETCNEEQALLDFKSYMRFYYPDWRIFGKPVVQEQSDCTYRIQFTTLDPHIRYEREVIIVEISYNYDYTKYNFRTIRGTLY